MARTARPSTRKRTGARVAAVQALFQAEQAEESAEAVIDQFLRHRLGPAAAGGFEEGRAPEADAALFVGIVRAATQQAETIDALIRGALPADWPLERLDPVLRALLRACAAELGHADGPPARVLINEYLDVAHGFFEGEAPRLANGVLDAIARALRAGEFAAPVGERG